MKNTLHSVIFCFAKMLLSSGKKYIPILFLGLFLFSSNTINAQLPVFENFEGGFVNWNDNGNDCFLGATTLLNGNRAAVVRDNSGVASSTSSDIIDLSQYLSVEIEFLYITFNLANGENFFVEYNDGSGFVVIANFIAGTNFNNGAVNTATLNLDSSTSNFTNNSSFRIRADASSNADQVVIDDINITGVESPYCLPSNTNSSRFIDDFSTTGGITNITNNNSGYSTSGYGDFTSLSASQIAGSTLNFSANFNVIHGFAIWIDFNDDGDFDDTDEEVYNSGIRLDPINGSFTIPTTAPVGDHRMRILADRGDGSPNSPCTFSSNAGEAEDYTFTVSPQAPCVEPTNQPTNLVFSNITQTSLEGDFTAATSSPDNYLVIYSTNNTPPTISDLTTYAIGSTFSGYTVADNDGDTTFSLAGLAPDTTYYFYIYSFNQSCVGGPDYLITNPLTGDETTELYCIPESINDETLLYFDDVQFIGTLNDVFNNAGNNFSTNPQGYQDWTGLPNSVQAQGQAINVQANAVSRGRIKAWVDWNSNGVFDNPSELIHDTVGVATSSTTFGVFIPANQALGEYTIRIRIYNSFRSDGTNEFWFYDYNPCEDFNTIGASNLEYGETEDYTFTVIESCPAIITNIIEGDVCSDGSNVSVDLTVSGSSGTSEFNWYANESDTTPIATTTANGSFTSTWTTPDITTTTDFYVTAYNGSCESLVKTRIRATVNEATQLSFTPSTLTPCGEDDILQVSASGANENVALIDEDFESGLASFTVNNIRSHSNAINNISEWQVESSIHRPAQFIWFPAISSGFGTNNFIMATSDIGTTDIIETAIESDVLDTSTMTNLTLDFDMYFSRYLFLAAIPQAVYIDVSTNGGGNWTTVRTYDDDIGFGTNFSTETLDLSTYIDETNLKIRFRYFADRWCDGVALDNIKLFGDRPLQSSFTWTADALIDVYIDAAATTLYTPGDFASIVYVSLTPLGQAQNSFTFDVTAVLDNGCNVTETIPVTNLTKTWSDSSVSDWGNASKWIPSGVPTINNCVIINETARVTPTNAYAKNISVRNGGSLELLPNRNLTVADQINVETGGEFTIRDGANLIQVTDVTTNENTGNSKLQRKVTGVDYFDYVYWSSPVEGFNVGSVSPGSPSFGIFNWNPTMANGTVGQHGAWTNTSENMIPGKGYIVRGLTSTLTANEAQFEGVLNNGIINVPISRGTWTGADYAGIGNTATAEDDNWNLIGNPYPSAISVTDFVAANPDINGTLYFWRHLNAAATAIDDPFYEDYLYNYNPNDYLVANSMGSTPSGFNGYIAAGQGFFAFMLDSAPTSSSVSFSNTMRGNYANNQFYRVAPKTVQDKHRIWLDLVDKNNSALSILVGFADGASNGIDRLYDGFSINQSESQFYSLVSEHKLSIQGKALPFDESETIPLGFNTPNSGSFTISINNLDGLFENDNQAIYLEDTELNIIHNLRANPYPFTTDSGTFNSRFILRFTSQTLSIVDEEIENAIKISNSNGIIEATSRLMNIETFELYDITGRVIHAQQNINNENYSYQTNNLSDGPYIVRVILTNGVVTSKKLIL